MRTEMNDKKYVNPYLAGGLLGLVLFGAYFLTGTGLGASGGLSRFVVSAQDLVAPRHVDRVGYLVGMAGVAQSPGPLDCPGYPGGDPGWRSLGFLE